MASRAEPLPPVLKWARAIALAVVTAGVAAATAASIAESFRALYWWALEHRVPHGWEASIAPLTVDVFIVVGECMLFVLVLDQRHKKWMIGAAVMSAVGLVLSFTGNVGHLRGVDFATRVTNGIWPIAASAGLAVSLLLLHLIAGDYHVPDATKPAAPAEKAAPAPVQEKTAAVPVPRPASARRIASVSATGNGKGVPPSAADLDKVRQHLRSFTSVDDLPSARALAREFFGDRQHRACRQLHADELAARADGRSHLVSLPDAQDPGHVNGKVEAVG